MRVKSTLIIIHSLIGNRQMSAKSHAFICGEHECDYCQLSINAMIEYTEFVKTMEEQTKKANN